MPLTVAIQMDPPERLNPATDSTVVLALEAQKRGHQLYYYTPAALYLKNGEVFCHAQPIEFFDRPRDWFALGAPETLSLAEEADVVLMRQDPPFNMEYITATYLLEQIHPKTLVVNHPRSVRDLPEKIIPLYFVEYMPPTLIASGPQPALDFYREYKDIVIKPLYGHGGHGVFRLQPKDANIEALLEMFWRHGNEPIIAQQFLPDVATEDRRVILIGGNIEGAFARIPGEGSIRANTRVGGSAVKAELTKKQRAICEAVGPKLRDWGLIFAGLDLIGDYLTEINITSPTGLRFVHSLYGTHPEIAFWDAVEKKTSS